MEKLLLIFLLSFSIQSQFQLPSDSYISLETKVSMANKDLPMIIDLATSSFVICCKPNRNIFQIIYNFMSNPFFQINQFACPNQPQSLGKDQLKLPNTGIISITYQLIEYPLCNKGSLGLSKQSQFLTYLPNNVQIFSISVNKIQSSNFNKYELGFGKISINQINVLSKKTLRSPGEDVWDFKVNSISLEMLELQMNSTVILTTNAGIMKIPSQAYNSLIDVFPTSQQCKVGNDIIYCPCQAGIPANFPSFFLKIDESFEIEIAPQKYLKPDSTICELLIKRGDDNKWHFDLSLFESITFIFDKFANQITFIEKKTPTNDKSSLIQLPIQLMLNCFVILLMCVFVSLIIIEIIKRVSGLADISDQSFRQYMIRRNIQ